MSAENTDRRFIITRFLKWILSILFFLSFCFILFVYVFLDPLIKHRIKKGVHESSEGLYNLEIGDLDAKFWSGAITMDNVWLRPDSIQLKKIKSKDTSAVTSDVNLYFDSVSISHIKWFRYILNNKKLEVGEVLIERPDFIVHSYFSEHKTIRQSDRNFLDLLPGIIAAFTGSLQIEAILVSNGHLHYDIHGKTGVVHQLADSIFIDLKKIRIDTAATKNDLYADSVFLDIKNYHLHTPDNLNTLHIKSASGTVHDSVLNLKDIHYFRKDSLKEQYKDVFEVSLRQVEGRGVDYGNLLRDQKIFLRTMILHAPDVELQSSENPIEKEEAADTNGNEKTLLDNIVPYLTGAFKIDTLSVLNGRINYKIVNSTKNIAQSAENIFLNFSRILVDTVVTGSKIYAEDMTVNLENYKLKKGDFSELNIASMKASVKDSLLQIGAIRFYEKKNDVYYIAANEVKGKGVDFRKILEEKKANMSSLVIKSPSINIVSGKVKKEAAKKYESPKAFFNEVLGPLADASLRVDKLIITNADIKYETHSKAGIIAQRAKQVTFRLDDVKVDSASAMSLDFFRGVRVTMDDYELKVHKQNFKINIDNVKANSLEENILLKDMRITQIQSFADTQRYYFVNTINRIRADKFDFQRLVRTRELHTQLLNVDEMNLEIFLDAGELVKPEYIHNMPHELMKKIIMYIRIDTANFSDSRLIYSNQEKTVIEPAVLKFDEMNFSVYNFTNDPKLMTDSTPAYFCGTALLMGEGKMYTTISIPLLASDFNGHFEGKIDSMRGEVFNSLLAIGGFKMTSGILLPSSFEGDIINGNAKGALQLVYQNLHIQLLDEKEEPTKKFRSKLANFVVKNNNPNDDEEEPEIVPLSAQRTPEDGFFFFLWRTIQSGIIETITKSTLYTEK